MTLKQLIAYLNSTLEMWPEGQVDKLNERTCYFYRNQGLLDAPLQVGPFAQYGEHHARQLLSIKGLQRAGKSLSEIKLALSQCNDTQLSHLLTSLGIAQPLISTQRNGHDLPAAPVIKAELPSAQTQTYIQIEPWGTLQVAEQKAPEPAPPELQSERSGWASYPISPSYTIIGAPGAPRIPAALLQQIQALLSSNLPHKS